MPVYWKPKYGTRSMRHRAWVRQELKREERVQHLRGQSMLGRIRARLRRL
jgi:hypothetical protein